MKRYKTNHGNLTTFVRLGERIARVKFVSSDGQCGYFATDNIEIQNALEKDLAFGVKIFLDEAIQEIETKPLPSDVVSVNDIASWQEAKRFLSKKPYVIPNKEMKTPDDIRAIAKRLKLAFNNIEGW